MSIPCTHETYPSNVPLAECPLCGRTCTYLMDGMCKYCNDRTTGRVPYDVCPTCGEGHLLMAEGICWRCFDRMRRGPALTSPCVFLSHS